MNVKNEISEELRSLSALVASISRQTPYEVPEGYFLTFPASVLLRVSKPLTFSVPDGYFEGFAKGVLDRIKAGEASKVPVNQPAADGHADPDQLPAILIQAGRKTPYYLPEGYFDELSPILTILREKTPYSVPVGYFDGLVTQVMAEVVAKTARQTAQPLAQPKVKPAAKVFSLASHRIWKYSAAAVVAGLLFSIGWLRLHNGSTITGNTPGADIAKTMSRVSDAELQSFLTDQDTTLAQPDSTSTAIASVDLNDNDLKSLLGDVPDGELKQYMDEHGGPNDIATN